MRTLIALLVAVLALFVPVPGCCQQTSEAANVQQNDGDKLSEALARYMRGQSAYQKGMTTEGYADVASAVMLLAEIDESFYRDNHIFLEVFSEASAMALNAKEYVKSVNYANCYVYLAAAMIDSSPIIKHRFLSTIFIAIKAEQALNNFEDVAKYANIAFALKTDNQEQVNLIAKIMVAAADAYSHLGNWNEAVEACNLLIIVLEAVTEQKDSLLLEANLILINALYVSGRITEARDVCISNFALLNADWVSPRNKAILLMDYYNIMFSLKDEQEAIALINQYRMSIEPAFEDPVIANAFSLLNILEQPENGQSIIGELNSFSNAIQIGDNEESRRLLDSVKFRLEAERDTLSMNYFNYLKSEISYNLFTQQRTPFEMTEKLLQISDIHYGRYHEVNLNNLDLAMVVAMQNEDKTILGKYMNSYLDIATEILLHRFLGMDKVQRERYWENINFTICSHIPAMAIIAGDNEQCLLGGYRAALLSKGLMLRSEIFLNDIQKDNKTDFDYNSKMQQWHERFINLCGDSAGDTVDEIGKIISEFSADSPLYSNMQARLEVSPDDVIKALRTEDMAVEFVWVKNTFLMAYILRKGWSSPKAVTIINRNDFDKISPYDTYSFPLLSAVIWKKIGTFADGVKNIYFAPDGPLHHIGIEHMPDYETPGAYISDRWNIYRLSSTRELAIRDGKRKANDSGLLCGGMLYDASAEGVKSEIVASAISRSVLSETLSADIEALNLRAGVGYLPETLNEANNISKLFESARVKYQKLTGLQASESNFKALSGDGASIIHIATHGFYWTKKDANKVQSLSFLQNDDKVSAVTEEDMAMRRSGLLFSGANDALSGGKSELLTDDGVLTAIEIAQLDLSAVDLLVLSACETGLGEISGDGVFGLQRGFKKAGVNSILMSLWKVDDKATQMLMGKFYEGYLAGKTKRKSLLDAQRYLREYEVETVEGQDDEDMSMTATQRRKAAREQSEDSVLPEPVVKKVRPYANPQYWAAFILLDARD